MSKWAPCKRRDFVSRLRKLGFRGLYSGTRHQFMVFDNYRLAIPSDSEYSVAQLKMMLKEIKEIIGREVSLEEWNKL